MDKKKPYWWISMKVDGHFRTLFVNNRSTFEVETENENWQNCIFFDNKEEADALLQKMKNLIMTEYPRAKDQHWFD